MNEAPDIKKQTETKVSGRNEKRTARTAMVAVVAVVAVAAIVLVLWLLVPRGSGGRPVPAPRSIGPDQTANQAGNTSEFNEQASRSKRWASVSRRMQPANKQAAWCSQTPIAKPP